MQQTFVILASQRTGSNMLVSVLDSHAQVRCHGELLRRRSKKQVGRIAVAQTLDDKRFRDHDYRQRRPGPFIKAVFALDPEAPIIGFKLMHSQSKKLRRRLIRQAAVKKVFLRRDNLLAVYSSGRIAALTGQGALAKGGTPREAKVTFSASEFDRLRARRSRSEARVRQELLDAGHPFLEVEYLEICTRAGQSQVLEFLGADPALPFESGTEKRNPSDILARFSNPEVVTAYLVDNGLEQWAKEEPAVSGTASSTGL